MTDFPTHWVKLIKNRKFFLPGKDVKIHMVSVCKVAELIVKLIQTEHLNQRTYPALDKEPVSLTELVNVIYKHFYGKKYPGYMKLPVCLFRCAESLCKLLHSDSWATRFQLISGNWWYNERNAEKELEFIPGDTILEFKKYLDKMMETDK